MKNSILLLFILCAFLTQADAQFATVNFDPELQSFNGNEPLPSEQSLLISGPVPDAVDFVEISVYHSRSKEGRTPLKTGTWKRPFNKQQNKFNVPLNFKLSDSKKYDLRITFYTPISPAEQKEVYLLMTQTLDLYLGQTFELKSNKIKFNKKTRQMLADMNSLVENGLSAYRIKNGNQFSGFSDLVRQKLNSIEDANLSKGQLIFNSADKAADRKAYRTQLLNDLKKIVHAELAFLLNNNLSKLSDSYFIDDYETEDKPGYFSINFGYGAVFLDGNVDDLNYGAAPYVGLSFPLSTSTIAPKFFRNASVTFGVFTKNFEDSDKNEITGPIIKRPIYLGLDYRLFQFVRFNAGAAFLEGVDDSGGNISDLPKRVYVQPFIGLSAKINLNLSLDK